MVGVPYAPFRLFPRLYPRAENNERRIISGLPEPCAPIGLPREAMVNDAEQEEQFKFALSYLPRFTVEHILIGEFLLWQSLEITAVIGRTVRRYRPIVLSI